MYSKYHNKYHGLHSQKVYMFDRSKITQSPDDGGLATICFTRFYLTRMLLRKDRRALTLSCKEVAGYCCNPQGVYCIR